uniref:E3 ubiquitin-protein ligase SINAT3-like n=1 Tax=Nicotiana sylvestris TaxID=4096 RepID=A0A1U7XL66_NICSY|nr:PREDICTED: E3 ubiquitin-protein ligase SINAT3-like [Nicotiana sylvestris]
MVEMNMDSIECVSSLMGGIEDEEIQSSVSSHQQCSSAKPHPNGIPSGIAPTSVHELLECPIYTNSMYPPIHQDLTGHLVIILARRRTG